MRKNPVLEDFVIRNRYKGISAHVRKYHPRHY